MQFTSSENVPLYQLGSGIRTRLGALVPNGARHFFVGGTSRSDDSPELRNAGYFQTLAGALPYCRAGYGDTIFVLPGVSENVSSTGLSGLVAGTRIIGLGDPLQDDAPTFTWNAVGSTWAMSVKNCVFENLRLVLGGADEVTKAINVTAAGCAIRGCHINVGTTALLNAAIAIEIGTGAHRFRLANNRIVGEVAGAVTDGILIAGVANEIEITGNRMFFATGAVTTGNIRIAAAALRMTIEGNRITNSLASSETCINSGAVAATGEISNNFVASEAGTPVSDLIEMNAATLVRCFQNFGSDTKNTSGLLTPAVVT